MAANWKTKRKVKRLVKEDILPSRRKYKTTYKDIKTWFTYLNLVVFDGRLSPFNDIQIKQIKEPKIKVWGQVVINDQKRKGTRQFVLEMLPYYNNKKEFVDTLAHECVHLYQMNNLGDTGNHNAVFYSYRSKLSQLGLQL
tara:strand:- start:46 stop:465 length:420 start_codon:yes stop_codon:yes gene_type:complete